MEGSDPEDIQQDLQAVSTAILHFERIAAARALGRLPFTNEMIVQALVAAQELDEHAGVREIAAEALQSQVHQAFIKEHPGLISQAVESARRDKEKRTSEEEARIAEEFQRTCKRQITLSLLPGAAVIVY